MIPEPWSSGLREDTFPFRRTLHWCRACCTGTLCHQVLPAFSPQSVQFTLCTWLLLQLECFSQPEMPGYLCHLPGTEVRLVPPLHTWFFDLELCSVIAFHEKYPLSSPEKLFIFLIGGSNSIKTSSSRWHPIPINYNILRHDQYVKHEAREAKRLAQRFTVSSGWCQDLAGDFVDRTAGGLTDLSSASYAGETPASQRTSPGFHVGKARCSWTVQEALKGCTSCSGLFPAPWAPIHSCVHW